MRNSFRSAAVLVLSVVWSCAAVLAQSFPATSVSLPPKVLDARSRYDEALAKAKADYARSLEAASKVYTTYLDRAMKDATKAGDLDTALAVKAEVQTVQAHFEEVTQKPISLPVSDAKFTTPNEFEPHIFQGKSGKTLPYRLLKPARIEPGKTYPLVLFFHGYGEKGTDNSAQLKNNVNLFLKPEVREGYPCYVLAPQAPGAWVGVSDFKRPLTAAQAPSEALQLSIDLLNAAEDELPVDRDRIYISGRSNGGYAVWYLLEHAPNRWAAAAPMCGGGDPAAVRVARGVPIWAFHGDNDPTVPVERSRELIASLKQAGGHPKYSEYPGLNHWEAPDKAYREPDLLSWLFAQKRSGH